MEERKAERERTEQESEREAAERIRVNDRRRVNLNDDAGGATASGAAEEPQLKPSYVEELEALTRAAEQKAADVQSRFEQVRAELQRETAEMRQRLTRTGEERVAREKASFVAALLPVIDNLQRAVEAAESGSTTLESLLNGLHGTISGFENVLASAGAEPIEAIGQDFDPQFHEAVDTIEVEPEREGKVTAQYGRGYRMGGQLLRPARVLVGRARGVAHGAAE